MYCIMTTNKKTMVVEMSGTAQVAEAAPVRLPIFQIIKNINQNGFKVIFLNI